MNVSYTQLSTYTSCQRKAWYKYGMGLRPLGRPEALAQGDAFHQAMEAWFFGLGRQAAYKAVDRAIFGEEIGDGIPLAIHFSQHANELPPIWWTMADPTLRTRWMKVMPMVVYYTDVYHDEAFPVCLVEESFAHPITEHVVLEGRVDAVVEINGDLWAMEHKTASRIDAAYLDRLWTDFQSHIYGAFYQYGDRPLAGVIYDIVEKCPLKQEVGETDEEFEARKADMKAPGRAKQKMPESDLNFMYRCDNWYRTGTHHFRQYLPITPEDREATRMEVARLAAGYRYQLEECGEDSFYRNRSACFTWGRACDYFPICSSRGNPTVIDNYYTKAGSDVAEPDATDELAF